MTEYGDNDNNSGLCGSNRNNSDINERLVMNLRDLSHTMRFLYEGKGSQKRILIILEETGGRITQQRLTERLGIQPGSVSEVTAKLESAGYIRRSPNETDRRTMDIELTEKGKLLAVEAKNKRIARHEQMFSALCDDEKNVLLSLLEKLNNDWRERYGDAQDRRAAGGQRRGEHMHRGEIYRIRRE